MLSQLPQPARHEGTQTPEGQAVVPWSLEHEVVQEPQVATVVRLVSHPSAGFALQFAYPLLHEIEQAPRAQDGVPFAPPHTAPQAPQLPRLVSVFVSHPLFGLPSQSPKAPLQIGAQVPATHEVVPFALVHTEPQAPQLPRLVPRSVPHPLLGLPSQSPQPESQTGLHAPATQEVVPCAFEQTVPHAPQWLALVRRSVSQPLAGFPSQSEKPVAQAGTQTPAVQTVVPFALVHAAPHAPQCWVVDSAASHPLTINPSQLPNPALQVIEQAPSTHDAVPFALLQAAAQPPQLLGSDCVAVSQPLESTASQFPYPAAHASIAQAPEAQVAVAWLRAQGTPHPPQLASVVNGLSQPLASSPSQLPVPGLQTVHAHVPARQPAWPPGQVHAWPQAPQWLTLAVLSVSQPLAGLLSQSPKPVSHCGSQAPATHEVDPWGLEQLALQLPHAATVFSSVSQPLTAFASQSPDPVEHTGVHTPAAQEVLPLGLTQPVPQAPQWLALASVSVSHPFVGLASQSPKPALHEGVQAPETQAVLPLRFVQVTAHPPQLAVVFREVSQPVATLRSQSPNPALQAMAHEPARHAGVPLVLSHTDPQAPQCSSLAVVSTSQPFPESASQSPNPGSQDVMVQVPVVQVVFALARLHATPQAPQSLGVVRDFSQPSVATPLQFPHPGSHAPIWQTPPKHCAEA